MKIRYLLSVCLLFNTYYLISQNIPGGVTDSEVWYISNSSNINDFPNYAQTDIKLDPCGSVELSLFNFNPSVVSDQLCIKYLAPLENSTGRNVFFVGEPNREISDPLPYPSLSHLGTEWNDDMQGVALTDSIIRNFFNLNTSNLYRKEIYADYSSDKNAQVNFYHTNHYNIDKKFKSYGMEGETAFYIGKPTSFDPMDDYDDNYFKGNFPEFISFPRELNLNEKIRVESYLALKYGLTLNKSISYLNSQNLIFWHQRNNQNFPRRIFGFGKDNISGLNQLQSESTHQKKHLVAAIGDIVDTNLEKQQLITIPNNHFLVFGDNSGQPLLQNVNNIGIEYWDKIWLAQRTGKDIPEFPMHFKLFLTDELINYLNANPDETLWLMQDKYIDYSEVSDFNTNIEYYEGVVDLTENIAYFEKVYFDFDNNSYDQFTFGVGPRMIVQADLVGCLNDPLTVNLTFNSGSAPFHVLITSSMGTIDETTNDSFYSFNAEANITYTITVTDNMGVIGQLEYTPEPWDLTVNLGLDDFISADQSEIILDASAGITDPDATYQWFHNGVLLPETGSTLVVTEPGDYEVVVTSADQSCIVSDSITIKSKGFNMGVSQVNGCDEEHNSITLDIEGGESPFFTTIVGPEGTTSHVHNEQTTISDFPYGIYTITVTDNLGEEFNTTVEFQIPLFEVDIYSQLQTICFVCYSEPMTLDFPLFNYVDIGTNNIFSLDASVFITSSNPIYRWYVNGILVSESAVLDFNSADIECYEEYYNGDNYLLVTVEVIDYEANCFASQSFYMKGWCPKDDNNPLQQTHTESNSEDIVLLTKVYPNPSTNNTPFYFEASSSVPFEGTVEIFTMSGSRLRSEVISGDYRYIIPFNLQSSGMYLIKLTSSLGIVETQRIIIK